MKKLTTAFLLITLTFTIWKQFKDRQSDEEMKRKETIIFYKISRL